MKSPCDYNLSIYLVKEKIDEGDYIVNSSGQPELISHV
jgi:hypothetical protein